MYWVPERAVLCVAAHGLCLFTSIGVLISSLQAMVSRHCIDIMQCYTRFWFAVAGREGVDALSGVSGWSI